ncbi:MAG: hypothetical protein V3T83_19020 [Acidobacteriota bacterium]
MACKTLKLPKVQEALKLALTRLDLPDKAIQALEEAVGATRPGSTAPDHRTRFRAATFVLERLIESERRQGA